MALTRDQIRAAYEQACRLEIEALKPGNVHVFAAGHDMTAEQFLLSARVSSGPLTDLDLPIGRRVLEAVRATREAVGTNTNLGIILLCGPIAAAAASGGEDLRQDLGRVLEALGMEDTRAVFEAILLAQPGGLGSAGEHDVREEPKVGLLEAMAAAADRDRIARQYVTGFQDVFEVGLPAVEETQRHGGMWPAVSAYMAFLSAFPDSHVARKYGPATAEQVMLEAREVRAALAAAESQRRVQILTEFDQQLKQRAINPGTSADLTVACLLVHLLSERLA
ncbi:triphosphoribosyl-dephospho-CoA synthase [Pseudaminobacter sp. 19-2017]|uniref:Triphosphoribosyl-dephospho-CoA synthase n=1 Tax=Pseudaminobacter soli (ex Zhang et al. 2022) TaxID=2831468 RepID=A0A942DWM6_9HYPH|nr:triphosphoribosyl-dephospho-CoA synthase [Pseudaminobacter soli]MBS3648373.1 triphosphoribosyl-dephospho-CoA synthase [Pseudaminobacter soli]